MVGDQLPADLGLPVPDFEHNTSNKDSRGCCVCVRRWQRRHDNDCGSNVCSSGQDGSSHVDALQSAQGPERVLHLCLHGAAVQACWLTPCVRIVRRSSRKSQLHRHQQAAAVSGSWLSASGHAWSAQSPFRGWQALGQGCRASAGQSRAAGSVRWLATQLR